MVVGIPENLMVYHLERHIHINKGGIMNESVILEFYKET